MKDILRQIILASLLVFLQVFVLNNLQLRGAISTFLSFSIYYFYILTLPAGTPHTHLYIVSFLLGLAVDLFADTLGVNAAACVFAGFVRIQILPVLMSGREQKQSRIHPSIYSMGSVPFIYYALILSFCFHLALCLLEVFTMHRFYITLVRAIVGTLVSTAIMLIVQYMFVRKGAK